MIVMLDYLNKIFEENIFKIVLSNATKINIRYKKIVVEKRKNTIKLQDIQTSKYFTKMQTKRH